MVHSLCGFDDVPRAVVVHVVFTANVLAVAMVVMSLGLYFLKEGKGKRKDKRDRIVRDSP